MNYYSLFFSVVTSVKQKFFWLAMLRQLILLLNCCAELRTVNRGRSCVYREFWTYRLVEMLSELGVAHSLLVRKQFLCKPALSTSSSYFILRLVFCVKNFVYLLFFLFQGSTISRLYTEWSLTIVNTPYSTQRKMSLSNWRAQLPNLNLPDDSSWYIYFFSLLWVIPSSHLLIFNSELFFKVCTHY